MGPILSVLIMVILNGGQIPVTGPVAPDRAFSSITQDEMRLLRIREIYPVSGAVVYKTGEKLGEGWFISRGAMSRILLEVLTLRDRVDAQTVTMQAELKTRASCEAAKQAMAEEIADCRRALDKPIVGGPGR